MAKSSREQRPPAHPRVVPNTHEAPERSPRTCEVGAEGELESASSEGSSGAIVLETATKHL
eukprot:11546197-Alexandrium_andersonii.AAC.1